MPTINLQFPGASPGSAPMGTIATQAGGSLSPTAGDTLPYSPTNRHPISTGAGWQMVPAYCGSVVSTVTVTNSLSLDWSSSTYFQYWIGASNQTFQPLFANQTPGQTVRVLISQVPAAIQGLVLWPAGTTGVGGVRTSSSITGGVDLFDVSCITQSTFIVNRLGGVA